MEKVKRKKWTDDETRRLIALSEKYTKSEIAKKLHRTPSSVGCKLQCLGVTGGLSGRTEKWNFRQIEEELGLSEGTVNKYWTKHGLKFSRSGYYCLVEEKEILRFMQEHPDMWNATKCDYYLFYQYPWFMKKLEEDKKKGKQTYYWTNYQKQQFESLKRKGYTHKQIAEAIGKSKSAVDHYNMRRKAAV